MINLMFRKELFLPNLFSTGMLILFLSCLGFGNGFAQQTNHQVLTIVVNKMDGTAEQSIAYPPGTSYKVYRASMELIPNEVEEGPLVLDGTFELLVYPTYRKDRPDQYNFKDQQVKIYTGTEEFITPEAKMEMAKQQPSKSVKPKVTPVLTGKKELTRSTLYPERYNLKFELSNGISFFYQDGKYSAHLDGKDLTIAGKYVIETKLGTAKLSFNPRTAELWWVFEPNEKE